MNVFDYFFENTKNLEKEFISGLSETISFKELHLRCLKLANTLESQGIFNENIILISDNSVFFTTVYLGIIKSGNTCVPLNPNIEDYNFKDILQATEAKHCFANAKIRSKFEEYPISIHTEKETTEWISNQYEKPRNHSEVPFDENRLAEIIYTSGSTGKQKGAMITHKNIITNSESIITYLKLTGSDRMQVVLPFYYCYGLSLLHTHLRVGGSLVFNNSFVFLGSVINTLNKYQCTGFAGVPSHFQILLRKSKEFTTQSFPTLRYVTQAGGRLHNAFIEEFTAAFPDIDFYVMYGQTEATARLSYLEPGKLKDKLGSIGMGIPGVELRVINEKGHWVKPGETGEIVAKGDNIMLGYYKDIESTQETIKNGWLFTGDLATIDEDGYIFVKGRKKEIFKIRGFRVSPKEIEDTLLRYPGVIDCSVKAVSDEITGESMIAIIYVDESNLENFSEEKIKQYCAGYLSPYKIPDKIIFETKLTYKESGKKAII
ncbi:MAG: AMP-binding protein [Bacteroidales bacterium]|nr:AMP-binding protein [Bacteroidales bacterium]